ncbi:Mannitol-1-phosphate 5-dehydrogenase [hydrothermal vent metagenome]|uniref:Mannitol-1-phosphate 5-dehydrogenase n=1 Tax=hydrothermal vent metagenome TaxID=652676 RepID=A0A3B0TEE5_9ZZZZ
MIQQDKIAIFGAGKIGRGFIGQLFSRGGFEVVFIDVYKPVINELNLHGGYNVVFKSGQENVIRVTNARGVFAGDRQKVVAEVATAGIAAVSVGLNGLKEIFPLLGEALKMRLNSYGLEPLDLIIAENTRNADIYIQNELKKLLPPDFPLDAMIGLIETSIGKMIPLMRKEDLKKDLLRIFAEPYNTLILDKEAFKNAIPQIEGLSPKENIKAWVDRKLFIHNLGHSAAAYIGYLYNPRFIYIYETLAVPEVYYKVRGAMLQSAAILIGKYPNEFSREDMELHINDLLVRFQNKALRDTVFRCGCDLKRKLGQEDRLVGAIKLAGASSLPYDKILYALVCACHFRAKDENGQMLEKDIDFVGIYEKGLHEVMALVCGFDEVNDKQLLQKAKAIDNSLKYLYKPQRDRD